MKNTRFSFILVLTCCILFCTSNIGYSYSGAGGEFSYIYIQGDKVTPFYVKTSGKMQPRYGKNYCIISSLTAGRIDVEILFELNKFPPEHFTIDVPENGYRGFLIDKHENVFALYDLKEKNYIMPVGK